MKILRLFLLIAIALFVFVPVVASPFSAPPAPSENSSPQTGPENPADLIGVLTWLAAGGAGAFVAVWIEKLKWFQSVPSEYKPVVVLAVIAGVALVPQLLLDFVPSNVWDVMGPYFATIMTAILVGYPVSQLFHTMTKKPT